MNGIFCSNFCHPRGIWQPCLQSWCAKCYKAYEAPKFHINLAEDDEGIVWQRKHEVDQFLIGRKGDHIFVSFQCDLCWFRNLKKRDLLSISQADQRLLAFIRRSNLDVFWSRTSGTVYKNRLGISRIINESKSMNFEPELQSLGPWPVQDDWGFGSSLVMLKASLEHGKNSDSYTQYDTIRKLGSAYTTHFEASKTAAEETWVMKTDKSNNYFTKCPTRSEFFFRFKTGLRARMGREVKGDLALDYKIVHKILFHLEEEMLDNDTTLGRRR